MSVTDSASELLCDALVFEYLKSRGLARTVEVYALETRRKYPTLADSDELAAQLWVNFRQKLGVNQFLRQQADAAAGKKGGSDAQQHDTAAAGATAGKKPKRGRRGAQDLSTLEFILKHTIRRFNRGGAFNLEAEEGDAEASGAAGEADGGGGGEGGAGGSGAEAGYAGGDGDGSDGGGGLSVGGGRKKNNNTKKKAKPRKYQSPTPTREGGINYNLQYHQLGKPLYRRAANNPHNSDDFATPSRESWMPMELRLKMLKRDMQLAKHKQQDINDWQMLKDKRTYKTDSHVRLKNLQELTARSTLSRNTCALCEHQFLQLPFSVSYKAIMDLRRTWNVKVVPESRFLKYTIMPHCYETVKVCVFCSQFFGLDFFDAEREKAVGVGVGL
jgi:hypothetical protein